MFVIQPEEIDAFLLPLPVGRLPGVGKVTEEKLAKLGIKIVREVRGLERSALENLSGRYGVRLYELAHGVDDNPVVPDRPTRSLAGKTLGFSRTARTVVLKLKTSEFKILTRSHTPGSPPSSCEQLTEIALRCESKSISVHINVTGLWGSV